MRRIISTSALLLIIGLFSETAGAATDHSIMTREEMAAKPGRLQTAPAEESHAFQSEWQNRLRQMRQEERQTMGHPAGAPQGGTGRMRKGQAGVMSGRAVGMSGGRR